MRLLTRNDFRGSLEQRITDLVDLLAHHDAGVVARSAIALGELQASSAIPRLIQLLEHHDVHVIDCSIDALTLLNAAEAIPHLIELLESDDLVLIELSVDALGSLKATAAIPRLIELLEHDDCYVIASSAGALGALKATAAIPRLIELLWHDDHRVIASSARALGSLNATEATPRLVELLEHDDISVIARSARALGSLNATAAIPRLIQLVSHENVDVVECSVRALGSLNANAAIPRLIGLLEHDDADVVDSSVRVLGSLNATEATPRLVRLLEHDNGLVIAHSAYALGLFGSTEAIPHLIGLFEHDAPYVLGCSACALGLLGSTSGMSECLQGIAKAFSKMSDDDGRSHFRSLISTLPSEYTDHLAYLGLSLDPQEDRRLLRIYDLWKLQTIQTIVKHVLRERGRRRAPAEEVHDALLSTFWLAAREDPLFCTPRERIKDQLFDNIRRRLSGSACSVIRGEHGYVWGKKTLNGVQRRVWQISNCNDDVHFSDAEIIGGRFARNDPAVELHGFLKWACRERLISDRQKRSCELLLRQEKTQTDIASSLGISRKTVGRDLAALQQIIRKYFLIYSEGH